MTLKKKIEYTGIDVETGLPTRGTLQGFKVVMLETR